MRGCAGMLIAAVLAAGCSSQRGPRPGERDALVVATAEPLGDVDPAACFEYVCAYVVLANTHEGLVRMGAGPPVAPEPALASSWTVSPDGTAYTFTLRTGARLHDGTSVTSDVVKASLERLRDTGDGSGPRFLLFERRGVGAPTTGITDIETPDERTVVIRLARPDSMLLARLAFPAVGIGRTGEDGPAGSGPYRIEERTRSEVVLARVRGDGPARVRLLFEGDTDAVRRAVVRGEAHIGVAEWNRTAPDPEAPASELRVAPGAAVRLLAFNTTRPPFDRLEVRRAVSAAVDRAQLAEGAGDALWSLVPDGIPAAAHAFETDPGSLEPLGAERIPVDLWYTPAHYGEGEEQAAQAIEAMLEASGRFDVAVHSAEWADFRASFSRGSYPAFLLGAFPDVLDPLAYLDPFLRSGNAAALGVGYATGEVDALLDEARATTDAARREEILLRLQQIAAADAPYVPLWQPARTVWAADGVEVPLDLTQVIRLSDVRS